MNRINIDEEFAAVVVRLGGEVLDRHYPSQDGVRVADFYFPRFNTVVELKRLEEDLSAKPDFQAAVRGLHQSWVESGRIAPEVIGHPLRISSQHLPESCTMEFVELVKKRVEFSTIKKANKQIKASKENLGRPDAKGWLIVANDGNLMMKPDLMLHVLARVLHGKHGAIHAVTYFSVNEFSNVPLVRHPALFWIDGILEDRDPPPAVLRDLVQKEWMRHCSKLRGGPVFEISIDRSPENVSAIDFIRKKDFGQRRPSK